MYSEMLVKEDWRFLNSDTRK